MSKRKGMLKCKVTLKLDLYILLACDLMSLALWPSLSRCMISDYLYCFTNQILTHGLPFFLSLDIISVWCYWVPLFCKLIETRISDGYRQWFAAEQFRFCLGEGSRASPFFVLFGLICKSLFVSTVSLFVSELGCSTQSYKGFKTICC